MYARTKSDVRVHVVRRSQPYLGVSEISLFVWKHSKNITQSPCTCSENLLVVLGFFFLILKIERSLRAKNAREYISKFIDYIDAMNGIFGHQKLLNEGHRSFQFQNTRVCFCLDR